MLFRETRTMSSNSNILESAMDGQIYPFSEDCILVEYCEVPGTPQYKITIKGSSRSTVSEGFRAVWDESCGT